MDDYIQCENVISNKDITRKGEQCEYKARYIAYINDKEVYLCKHHLNKLLDDLEKDGETCEWEIL